MKKTPWLLKVLCGSVLLIGLFTEVSIAQKATLSGIVTEYESGESLEGANVTLINLSTEDLFGAATDRDGIYSVNKIDPGTYRIVFSFLGYISQTDTLTFEADEEKSISVSLRIDDVELGEVTVRQQTSAARSEMGRQRISSVDVGRISSPVAGGDLVNYLQVMPGVVSLGNRGGQLFIRGGTPSENMVLVDGSLVYKPFHILSFFSPFPDNLVSSADFYPGGFNSEFSGRISSVLDVSMRNGDRFEFGGSGSVSPFIADVMFEGPLKEDQLSIIVSAKQSFIDETSSWYLSERQPLRFESQYVKLSNLKPGSNCSGTIMRTHDEGKINTRGDETVEWSNFMAGINCEAFNDQNFFKFNSHVSNLSNASIYDDRTYESAITQFRTDISISRYYGNIRADYGVLFRIEWMNYDLIGRVNGLSEDDFDLKSTGGNIQFSIPLGDKITLEPGAVLSLYNDYPASIEPRVRFAYEPFGEDKGELNAAAGIYRQGVFGFTDSRDATGVFVTWNRIPGKAKQAEARHALVGWQQGIGSYFNYSFELYYKQLYDIPVSTWSPIAKFSTNLRLSDGSVYGSDARIEYDRGNFYGLLSYGYTNTTYEAAQDNFGVWFGDPVVEYNPSHDRRHQVNAVASYDLGKFSLGARWQYGSGAPFTRPLGFDEVLWFDRRFPDVTFTTGDQRVIIDRPFEGRLPSYHSLDLSVERVFNFANNSSLATKIGTINAYNRNNMFYYDVFTQERINQLPMTAYISLRIDVN